MRRAIGLMIAGMSLLGGCGSNGGSSPVGTVTGGRIEGFAFAPSSRQGATLVLGRNGSAPDGFSAAAGATVGIVGGDATTTTDGAGHFLLTGVDPGLQTVRLGSGSSQSDYPVTVIPDALVTLGPPPVLRGAAVDAARQAVAALETETGPLDPAQAAFFVPAQPLPADVAIDSFFNPEARSATVTVPSESWLVYADLTPNAGFSHEARWYLIDAATGTLTAHRGDSPPVLNGAVYYAENESNRTSADLVSAPATAFRPAPALLEASATAARDHTSATTTPQLFGLVILGDRRPDFVVDYNTVGGFLGAEGATWFAVTAPIGGQPAINAQAEITATFNHLNQQLTHDRHDTLYVSLHSHGLENGTSPFVQQSLRDGTPARGAKHNFSLTSLPWAQVRACHIIIHIDTCFAEAHLNAMKAAIEGNPSQWAGKKVIIVASSKADEISLAGSGGEPPGGFFTTPFIAALGPAASRPVTVDQVSAAFDTAKPMTEASTMAYPVNWDQNPARATQHPVKYLKPMLPGETCGPNGATVSGLTFDEAVSVGGQVVIQAGSSVPLSRIQDYRIAPPELPVTDDRGCAQTHIHAAQGAEGIRVRLTGGPVVGPIQDPAPSKCGYGHVTDVPYPTP